MRILIIRNFPRHLSLLALAVIAVMALTLYGTAMALDCTQPNLSTNDAIQCGTNGVSGTAQTPDQATTTLNTTITNIINILSSIIGIVAVIMIIFGGFRYITSGGNAESTKSAKNTILYAIVGLVIVALAQVIVRFVLDKTTTSDATTSSSAQGVCTDTQYGRYWVNGPNNGKAC